MKSIQYLYQNTLHLLIRIVVYHTPEKMASGDTYVTLSYPDTGENESAGHQIVIKRNTSFYKLCSIHTDTPAAGKTNMTVK